MELLTHTGSFTIPTSGSPANVSLPFAPKAIMFYWTDEAPLQTDNADSKVCMGQSFTDGTNQYCMAFGGHIWGSATRPGRGAFNDRTIITVWGESGGFTSLQSYATVAFVGNGFSVSVGDSPFAAYRVGYFALGGDGIDAKVLNFSIPTSGPMELTGVGFEPDVLFFLCSRGDGYPINTVGNGSTNYGQAMLGWAINKLDGTIEEHCATSNNAIAWTGRYANDAIWGGSSSGGVERSRCSVTSFTPDGAIFNVLNYPPGVTPVGVLALKNVAIDVQELRRETLGETGEVVTGFAEKPAGLLAVSLCNDMREQDVPTNFTIGSYDGVNQSTAYGYYGGNIGTDGNTAQDDALLYDAGVFTVVAVSLNPDGYTVTYAPSPSPRSPLTGGVVGNDSEWVCLAWGLKKKWIPQQIRIR
jgi:hypothetical protein